MIEKGWYGVEMTDRRRFLKLITAYGVTGALLPSGILSLNDTGFEVSSFLKDLFGVGVTIGTSPSSKEITSNDDFFIQSYSQTQDVDIRSWRLRIDGLVEKPYTLTYEEITRMPEVSEYVTLECIGNGVGGDLIGNALWTGIPLKVILEKAMVKASAKDLVLHGADGYTDSIPLKRAMSDYNLLAYKMNGVDLPKDHGYPLRLVVPGIYGMKNVKWLERIELVDWDYKGYWERRGWSDEAIIGIMSRIDAPKDGEEISGRLYTVSGIAFAGTSGIGRVEVSTDNGKTWQEAEMKEPLSPYAWVLWRYSWNPPAKGKYTIMARATDRDGRVQTTKNSRPFPNGSTGLHSVTVKVY